MSGLRRLTQWNPDVLVLIMIANLLLFAISMYLSFELAPHALPADSTSPSSETLYILGMNTPHLVLRGHVYRLVTAVFLHASVLHLLMNSVGLINLGRHVQGILGPRKFWTVYMLTGLLGSLASLAWYSNRGVALANVAGSVGASGAVCGLLGFLFGYLRNATDHGSVMVRRQLVFWSILMLVIGFMPGSRIDNAGHIGGGVAGYLLAIALDGRRGRVRALLESRALATALIVVALGGLGWGLASWYVGWGAHARELLPARELRYAISDIEFRQDGARARAIEYLRELDEDPGPWTETESGSALIAYLRTLVTDDRASGEVFRKAEDAMRDLETTLGPYRR